MDMLVLNTDGKLFVATPNGTMPVIVQPISSPSSSSAPSSSPEESGAQPFGRLVARLATVLAPTPKPIRLAHAHGHFVSVIYADGSSMRVCTDMSPLSSLVRSCFQILAQLCSSPFVLGVRLAFLLGAKEIGGGEIGEEREFGAFAEALMDVLNRDAEPAPGMSLGLSLSDGPPAPSDAWSKMLAHPVYARLSTDPALQSLPMPLPTFHPPSSPSPRQRAHPDLMRATHALHLLGEELKMDCRRYGELGRLARLMIRLGGAVGQDWMEYWLRVCPDSAGEWKYSHICESHSCFFAGGNLLVLTSKQISQRHSSVQCLLPTSSASFTRPSAS